MSDAQPFVSDSSQIRKLMFLSFLNTFFLCKYIVLVAPKSKIVESGIFFIFSYTAISCVINDNYEIHALWNDIDKYIFYQKNK